MGGGGFCQSPMSLFFFKTFTKSTIPSFHDICHNWYSKKYIGHICVCVGGGGGVVRVKLD